MLWRAEGGGGGEVVPLGMKAFGTFFRFGRLGFRGQQYIGLGGRATTAHSKRGQGLQFSGMRECKNGARIEGVVQGMWSEPSLVVLCLGLLGFSSIAFWDSGLGLFG